MDRERERDMMISGMLTGNGLWEMPNLRVFMAVTCRIPYMIKRTSHDQPSRMGANPILFTTGEMNAN
jgi:hypothetical protein